MNLVLYGFPGSGKTTVGKTLAEWLGREFVDTDALIEARNGRLIRDLFAKDGEAAFRRMESDLCREIAARSGLVIACGGGMLLDPDNRAALEAGGRVVVLKCDADEILRRLRNDSVERPLVAGDDPRARLNALLDGRQAHYDSFALTVDTTGKAPEAVAEEAIGLTGEAVTLRIDGRLGHEYLLGRGLIGRLDELLLARGLEGRSVVVTDSHVAALLKPESPIIIPAGEQYKTLDSARTLYDAFLDRGLDRRSVVIALGGGVIGDLAGFTAATFMRGITWVAVPTTLLAMVDASIGSKVAVDLPRGKNLVGAFHPPKFVLADLDCLDTLPEAEFRSGMSEVVKAGVIGDAQLFAELETANCPLPIAGHQLPMIKRAVAVKARVVGVDPFEEGERAVLNLGHTVAHGLEAASNYSLRHGEAVAIGMVAEARMAEAIGLCSTELPERIEAVLKRIGLPVRYHGLDPRTVREAMNADKKKAGGRLKFSLPEAIGKVRIGCEVEEAVIMEALEKARITFHVSGFT
ncbi:MAG: 3-dehydroquinate synthase [Chloroflexi bacterium]|nr:3-dehydroquinate synthase [Chloroflexota bacterium]